MREQNVASGLKYDVRCDSCPVRHRAICSRADDRELSLLDTVKFYKTYQAGQTIALRGDPLDTLSSVVSGNCVLKPAVTFQ